MCFFVIDCKSPRLTFQPSIFLVEDKIKQVLTTLFLMVKMAKLGTQVILKCLNQNLIGGGVYCYVLIRNSIIFLENDYSNMYKHGTHRKGYVELRQFNRRYPKDSPGDGPCSSEFSAQIFVNKLHQVQDLRPEIFLKSVQPFRRYGYFWFFAIKWGQNWN